MYCPRCGQQQLSDEVRFCPRCGMPLIGVTALLAADSARLSGEEVVRARELTARRAGLRRGSKLVLLSIVLLPLFIGLGIIIDSPAPLFAPVTLFLAGLAWLLYFALFGADFLPAQGHEEGKTLWEKIATPLLGAPQSVPASGQSPPRVKTTELSQPPSTVTEHTTALLDKDRP